MPRIGEPEERPKFIESVKKERELLNNMVDIEGRIEQKLKEIDDMVFVTKTKDEYRKSISGDMKSPLIEAGMK